MTFFAREGPREKVCVCPRASAVKVIRSSLCSLLYALCPLCFVLFVFSLFRAFVIELRPTP